MKVWNGCSIKSLARFLTLNKADRHYECCSIMGDKKGGKKMDRPKYIEWIVKENGVALENGEIIKSFLLDYKTDDAFFDDWAIHVRRHYISDKDLQTAEEALGLSPAEYLRTYVIPQKGEDMGGTARSNDLTEILVADILEFIEGYHAPRIKQLNRSGKNLSEHGTDIIAYKYHLPNKYANTNDELLAVEVKAKLTGNDYSAIGSAIKDSQKDEVRIAHTLDYYRKKLNVLNMASEAAEIARFQNKAERNYKTTFIAAAVSSVVTIPNNVIIGIEDDMLQLALKDSQRVFYVHGEKLMDLAHQIYERCRK